MCTIRTHEFNLFFFWLLTLFRIPSSLLLFGTDSPTNVNVLVTQKIPDCRTKEIYLFFGKKKCTKVTRCPGKYFQICRKIVILSFRNHCWRFCFLFLFFISTDRQNKNFLKFRHPQRPGHVDLK
jgi:hypothetical protein